MMGQNSSVYWLRNEENYHGIILKTLIWSSKTIMTLAKMFTENANTFIDYEDM